MRSAYMPPWVIQATGLLLILFFAVVWLVTNRIEPTLLAVAGTLIGLGQYQKAKQDLTSKPEPPPVAKDPVEEPNGS